MDPSRSFVAVDANWDSALEIYRALSGHLPGVVVEAREWRQARRAGWFRSGQRRLKQLAPALWRTRYALPPGWFHSMNPLSMRLLARSIGRQARLALGHSPGVWIFSSPYYLRILLATQPEFAVYYPVDDYRWYWPRLARRTERFEAAMVARADLVVCVSRYNRSRLQELCRDNPDKVVHVPNGAPERFFLEPDRTIVERWRERLAPYSRPLFAYVGNPVGRVNAAMIQALAAATTGTILFAGPTSVEEFFGEIGAIRALGPVPGDEVPAFLRAVDVLVAPQEDNEFNRACSPRKLWEYLASGKPVVGACLTEVDPMSDGIRVANSQSEFVRHALNLAVGGDTAQDRDARRKLAEEHRYPVLARRLAAHLAARRPDLVSDEAVSDDIRRESGSFGEGSS